MLAGDGDAEMAEQGDKVAAVKVNAQVEEVDSIADDPAAALTVQCYISRSLEKYFIYLLAAAS